MRRRRRAKVRYWVNGFGPFATAAERDAMLAALREVAEWNRAAAS